MSIITYPVNGVTYHAEDAETYLCSRASGVYSAEGCFDVSISDDMELSVSPGLAWIKNGDYRGKSVCSTETEVLEVPIADASLPRIDRVVIEFTTAANGSTIKVVTGTPAAEPAAPAIVRTATVFQLGLCTVRVPAAATAIQARHIIDTRTDETVCGLMRDAVTRIPTTELRERFIDDVQNIVDGIRDILDEETAGHLLNLINTKAETATYTIEITTTGWTATDGSAPYYKTISVPGITEDDNPIVGLVPPESYSDVELSQTAFGSIYSITTAEGSITVYAKVIPSVTISIQAKVVR